MAFDESGAFSTAAFKRVQMRAVEMFDLAAIQAAKADLRRGIMPINSNHTQVFTDKAGDSLRALIAAASSVVIQVFSKERRAGYAQQIPEGDLAGKPFIDCDMAVALTFEQTREFIVQLSRVYTTTVVNQSGHVSRLADDVIRALANIPNKLDAPDAENS